MEKMKVMCAVGTRPEVIKMAPVIKALQNCGFEVPILATAQHRDLLDQMMATFGVKADWDLDIMRPAQRLADVTGELVPKIYDLLMAVRPHAVLAQGDTTTVLCVSLAAFYAGIPFGHVEAGLRSGDLQAPFPEEANRRLAGVLAHWHFAPTERASACLLRESHKEDSIKVVGNPVIDALLQTAAREDLPWPEEVPQLVGEERLVLVTLHRRENFGAPLERILGALAQFAKERPDTRLVYPVHPNPSVKGPAEAFLGSLPNVQLVRPVDYPVLVNLMRSAFAVFTDSGGIQEEAPALGKPVLVFRDVTERPEAVEAGGVLLVGSDPERFHQEATRLWDDPAHYQAMAQPRFPYGRGDASERIAQVLLADLGLGLPVQAEQGLAS